MEDVPIKMKEDKTKGITRLKNGLKLIIILLINEDIVKRLVAMKTAKFRFSGQLILAVQPAGPRAWVWGSIGCGGVWGCIGCGGVNLFSSLASPNCFSKSRILFKKKRRLFVIFELIFVII